MKPKSIQCCLVLPTFSTTNYGSLPRRSYGTLQFVRNLSGAKLAENRRENCILEVLHKEI